MQRVDHRTRRRCGREQRVPALVQHAVRAAFGSGGNLGGRTHARGGEHRDRLDLAALRIRQAVCAVEIKLCLAGDEGGVDLTSALVGHMNDVHPGALAKHFRREVRSGSVARGGVIEFARLGSGERDQFLQIVRRHSGGNQQQTGHRRKQADRRKILLRIERNLSVEMFAQRKRAEGREQQGMAVRLCPRHRLGTDIAARAGAVLYHRRLTERGRQFFRKRPRHQVGGTARTRGYDDADHPRRVGRLRHCGRRRKIRA